MRWKITTILFLVLPIFVNSQGISPPTSSPKSTRILAPCQACRLFVSSFKHGMDRTSRGKFEGGDAAWEEEKMGSYARSEVRLVEIQEKMCSELKEHNDRCHALAEENEHLIEEWWFKGDPITDNLFEWLCIDKLQNCCPLHHYGENCEPCKDGIENPCGGNGKCKGDGTRKGNGECACDLGYSGLNCNNCDSGYYESYKDEKKLLCSKCHKSCKGECTEAGVIGCKSCNKGWTHDPVKGCLDINECLDRTTCQSNQFCVNEEGTYKCLFCDKSCDGCTGDGPDMCKRCAPDFQMKDGMCKDSNTIKISRRITFTRYLTYFGLSVTIIIIFQRSTIIAGILGLFVALYISVSEYMLANEQRDPNQIIDPGSIDISKFFTKGS